MDYAIGTVTLTKNEADFLDEFLQAWGHMAEAITFHHKVKNVKECVLEKKYTPETLLGAVCELTGFTPEQIHSRQKSGGIADVRASISVIAHELWPNKGLHKIGYITNKNHCTVLHHYQMVRDIREVREVYLNLKFKLGLL